MLNYNSECLAKTVTLLITKYS